ncbi:MAG: fatty acid desaturase [Chitinophagaceae bacterium]
MQPAIKRVKYTQKPPIFFSELRNRINKYFEDNSLSRYADNRMHIKTISLILIWLSLYGLIISNLFKSFDLILIQAGFHWMSFVVWNGIAHDAHHQAYTKNKIANRLLLFTGDLVGVSSYVMDFNHVKSHHSAVNIPVHDVAIDDYGIFRFHPHRMLKWYHKWQHIYINVFYMIPTLFKLLIFDYFSLSRKYIGSVKIKKHRIKDVLYLTIIKLGVIYATLILPLQILDAPRWIIITGFLTGHFVAGFTLSLIFQITHLCDYSNFSDVDLENGNLENSFAQHVIENTSSFATDNLLLTYFSGGLNHHTIHHLFPEICQIHFPALTKILRATSEEYGIPFKIYPTFWSAIQSHYSLLKKLGSEKNYRPRPFSEWKLSYSYLNN